MVQQFTDCTLTMIASDEELVAVTLDEGASLSRLLSWQSDRNAITLSLISSPWKSILEKLLWWAGFDVLTEVPTNLPDEKRQFVATITDAIPTGNIDRIRAMAYYLASWGMTIEVDLVDEEGVSHPLAPASPYPAWGGDRL